MHTLETHLGRSGDRKALGGMEPNPTRADKGAQIKRPLQQGLKAGTQFLVARLCVSTRQDKSRQDKSRQESQNE